MAYLLDTNVWITSLRGRNSLVSERIRQTPRPETLLLCAVVKAELLYGAIRSAQPQRNLHALDVIFQSYASLPFDDAAAQKYAELRTDLEKKGKSIGPNDLMIAAIALAAGLTLVTNNTSEFSRVPGLQCEDWQTP
jgi:tRNA(fMet)-specific endonuclease VapC